jgi:GH24 family phage-related lysozyme (muramidase)
MYLDSANPPNVTAGKGHLIAGVSEAQKLGFLIGDRPATSAEVAADFARVAAAPRGHTAAFYQQFSQCRLSSERIDAILADDIASHEAAIRAKLPAFDSWPESVQEAVFDIGFNCGLVELLKFHHMLDAINARDWEAAAASSHRHGISQERNDEIADLFRAAIEEEVAA